MNTYFFKAVVAAAIILISAAQASACRRCGHHGSFCHFAPQVVHHTPPATVTNFIFGAQYPGNYLPQQGGSVYGYGLSGYGPSGFALSAQAQYVDPAMLFDRAGRFTELSLQQGSAATQQFKDLGAQALALNDQLDQRNRNTAIASVAITALQANTTASPQAQSLKVSVKSTGETVAEWLPAFEEGEIKPLAESALNCAKCHNKTAAEAPHGFVFDGKSLSQADADWAKEQVWAGKMPPKANLDRAAKSKLADKLQEMVK